MPDKQTFGSPNSPLLPAIPPSKDVNAESGEAGAEKDEGAGFRDSDVVVAALAIAILVVATLAIAALVILCIGCGSK
jgi:hypothetical protein